MQVFSKTDRGLVRPSNQDSLLVTDRVYAVADGMGGHKGGETASRVAVQVLRNALQNKTPEEEALRMGVEAANRRIYEMQKRDPDLSGMGTTLTLLWERDDSVLIAHVGDSRAYLFRDNELRQQTEDHSMVAEMLRQHIITPEAAKTHPYRNIITRALGTDPVVTPDIFTVDKLPGDVWLVCSDGLYNHAPQDDMWEILHEHEPEQAAEQLLALALANGGSDNISLILAEVPRT